MLRRERRDFPSFDGEQRSDEAREAQEIESIGLSHFHVDTSEGRILTHIK